MGSSEDAACVRRRVLVFYDGSSLALGQMRTELEVKKERHKSPLTLSVRGRRLGAEKTSRRKLKSKITTQLIIGIFSLHARKRKRNEEDRGNRFADFDSALTAHALWF